MNKSNAQKKFIDGIKMEFSNCYRELKNKKIVLFGAGSYGEMMAEALDELCGFKDNIIAFSDNDSSKWGKKIYGITVENIKEIKSKYENFVVIISSQYDMEIIETIKKYNVNIFEKPNYEKFVEQMLTFYVYKTTVINERLDVYRWIGEYYDEFQGRENQILDLLEDDISKELVKKRISFYQTGDIRFIEEMPVNLKQYFDREYLDDVGDNEVFVDCGAYIGDSIEEFIEFVDGNYKKIYAFEPDRVNFEQLGQFVRKKQYKNVVLHNIATGKETGFVQFSALGTTGSHVIKEGGVLIDMDCIDNVVTDIPTWIKMDIEGAEYETLQGCENLIKNYAPKLSICIYHKCEDLFTIPFYLKKLVPNYKFKIRQHGYHIFDTVLYAYVEN